MGDRPWVVHLLGFPAVGKRTVGVELVAASEQRCPDRFVLIDNHLSSHPILAVLDGGGAGVVADDVWDRVGEIREVVDRAILELAPPHRSFVFTNAVVAGDDRARRGVERVQRLARARASTYVPVVLRCARDELLQRVPNEDRRTHGKWTDRDEVAAHLDRHQPFEPDGPHGLELDTTTTPAASVAQAILDHLDQLAAADRS